MKYTDFFAKELNLINGYLEKEMPAGADCPPLVNEAMRYAVLGEGKRFRPVLALAVCAACGGEPKKALPAAAALELIHAYSLVHDDLPALDNDDMRRGQPSCHKKFGEAMAILAGDGLLTLAFEWVGRVKPAERALAVLAELSTAAGTFGMIGGQAADIRFGADRRDMAMLDYISIHKTGCLIRAAAVIGALAAGAPAAEIKAARKFGECIGLAFQIADDIDDRDGYLKLISRAEAEERVGELGQQAKRSLRAFKGKTAALEFIMDNLISRMQQTAHS